MMTEIGHCKGIENYSRFLSGRRPGEPPPTLFDYLPPDADPVRLPSARCAALHRRKPRDRAAARGACTAATARARRPWSSTGSGSRPRSTTGRCGSTSSSGSPPRPSSCPRRRDPTRTGTRGRWSSSSSAPPGSSTPHVEVRPASAQVDDLLSEIHRRAGAGERVLVTTLTKRMAEDLTGLPRRARGCGCGTCTPTSTPSSGSRSSGNLRLGEFDVLVGINLLREGLGHARSVPGRGAGRRQGRIPAF